MSNSFDPSSLPRSRSGGTAWARRQWRKRLKDLQPPQHNVTPISRRRRGGDSSLDLPPLQGSRSPRVDPSVRPFSSPRSHPRPSSRSEGVRRNFVSSTPTPEPFSPRRYRDRPAATAFEARLPLRERSQDTTSRPSVPKSDREPRRRPPSTPSGQPSVKREARRSRSRRPTRPARPTSFTLVLYAARLAVAGIGLGAIAGTMLALWSPSQAEFNSETTTEETTSGQAVAQWSTQAVFGQELTGLERQLRELVAEYPGLTPGVAIVDTATGDYAQMSQAASFPAASTIKVPILVAFFQAVDAGQVRLDEMLTIEESHLAEGSGSLQYENPGLSLSALEVATLMIVQSDNTATNMLIDRLGGYEALNAQFRRWGMMQTTLREMLPDLDGTNTTTPKELAVLLGQIEGGELLSMASRDRLLRIMMQTENDSLLPQGLGQGAAVAHKTGNLRSVLADAGLIDAPNGKRYVAVVLVKRPDNDERAAELIRQISARTYDRFVRPVAEEDGTPVEPTMADTQQAQR